MLPPQMGLKVTICLEWSTFATLMMTMKWLWYCDTMIVLEMPRPSILRFEHPLAAINSTFEILFRRSVCHCEMRPWVGNTFSTYWAFVWVCYFIFWVIRSPLRTQTVPRRFLLCGMRPESQVELR